MSERIGEKLLTVEEVAEMLGVSTAFVYQHASGSRRPKIPCVKIGRSVRFRLSSIEEFIRALEQVA
jgi:excisionase family DNA binding protein